MPGRLAEALLPVLRRRLMSWNARTRDPHLVDSAIADTIVKYLRQPEVYDPSKMSLDRYLAMDARGDIRNALQSHHDLPDSDLVMGVLVELPSGHRKSPVEDEALDDLDPYDRPPSVVEAARRQLATLSDRDRELAELLVENVRSYAIWADRLGITHLPLEKQRREVKRQKDRISKKLERLRGAFANA